MGNNGLKLNCYLTDSYIYLLHMVLCISNWNMSTRWPLCIYGFRTTLSDQFDNTNTFSGRFRISSTMVITNYSDHRTNSTKSTQTILAQINEIVRATCSPNYFNCFSQNLRLNLSTKSNYTDHEDNSHGTMCIPLQLIMYVIE